jgi:hypothetical protein
MSRPTRLLACFAVLAAVALPGCAALQQLAALRTITFAFAGLTDVRVAGVRIGAGSSFSSLSLSDAARIGAAVVAKSVPLDMVAHVSASNPPENTVTARMVDLGWKLFIEDRQMLAGQLNSAVSIAPGRSADVPLTVRFDLLDLGTGGARDLFDLALAIAGQGSVQKDLKLELTPTIETSLGPMSYPVPVVVRRGTTTP